MKIILYIYRLRPIKSKSADFKINSFFCLIRDFKKPSALMPYPEITADLMSKLPVQMNLSKGFVLRRGKLLHFK